MPGPPREPSALAGIPPTGLPDTEISLPTATPPAASRVVFRWSKKLGVSDVNKNKNNARNFMSLGTGRGKAARVMAHIDDIRRKMMADRDWSPIEIRGKDAEVANVAFEVRLPGELPRSYILKVVHACARRSRQLNYHTSIQWDAELAQKLRTAPGKGFAGLYAVLEKFDSGRFVLTISSHPPHPRGIGFR